MKISISIFIIALFFTGCRQTPSFTKTHKPKDYVGSIFRDAGDLVQTPVRWDSSDAQTAGIVGSSALVIMQFDRSIRDFSQAHRSGTADYLADLSVPFGTQRNVINGAAGTFALSYALGDYEIADTAFLALEANFFSHSIMGTMKGTTKRVRPHSTDDPFEFHFFDKHRNEVGSSAFPSGDVTTAFTWAAVVSESTDSPTIDVVSYGLAGLVAMQRVYYNAHWTSDVFVGAVVGITVGTKVVRMNRGEPSDDLSLTPIINNDFVGMGTSIRF
ncbi:MAG: phosphatase PAP2 family protein [Planctomycetota bacterium]